MIQSVQRALAILDYLGPRGDCPARLSEIATAVGLHQATCAHLVKTLADAGYVVQVDRQHGYTLGPQIHRLAQTAPYRPEWAHAVRPLVERLVQDVGESAVVAGYANGKRYLLLVVETSREVQVNRDAMVLDDLTHTATGRLLLAHQSIEEIERYVRQHGLPGDEWPEASTREGFARVRSAIRRDGLVIYQRSPEITQIAVPLLEGAHVVAALGIFLPGTRFIEPHRSAVTSHMRATAQAIAAQLAPPAPSTPETVGARG